MLLLFVVLQFLVFFWNYRVQRAVTHPAVVYAFLWFLQVFGLAVFQSHFIEPSTLSLLVVFMGGVFFSLGGFFSKGARCEPLGLFLVRGFSPFSLKSFLVGVIALVALVKQYEIFSDLSNGSSFAEALVTVRTLMNAEGEDVYGVYKYGSAFSFVLLMMFVAKAALEERYRELLVPLVMLFLISCGFSVLSTGRGALLQVVIAVALIPLVVAGGQVRLGKIFGAFWVILILAYLIFQVMGEAMGKAGSAFDEVVGNIVDYQFSSIPALSYYLERKELSLFGGDWGENVFRVFHVLLYKLGWLPEPKSLIQEFVLVPVSTNIYTNYHLFIQDFGILGLVVFSFFIGYIHSSMYEVVIRHRGVVGVALLGVSYLPLLQSVSGEAYITNFSRWVQIFLLAVLLGSKRLKAWRRL